MSAGGDGRSGDEEPRAERRIAVALSYDNQGAPRVVARGEGFLSDQILRLAAEHGVPVEENPLLAQALAQVALDEEIPEELYQAVAVIIGYILRAAK